MMEGLEAKSVPSVCTVAGDICKNGNELLEPEVNRISPYATARNLIMDVALKYRCDLLLWIDSDMIVPMDGFSCLLKSLREEGAVMSVGHAHRRGYPYTPTWFKRGVKDDIWQVTAPPGSGCHQIDACGLAFNLIDLKWVESELEKPYHKNHHEGKPCGEDAFFCKQVGDRGGKIVGDSNVRCKHIGDRIVVDDDNADYLRSEWIKRREGEEDRYTNIMEKVLI